jgi:hypothetical protein
LKHRNELRKKIFFINKSFPYVNEFTQIFLYNYNPIERIKEYFKTKIDLDVVVVNT